MQAPYSPPVKVTNISPSKRVPKRDDLAFVKGDQVTVRYLWKNMVFTPERPVDEEGLPLYSEDEDPADEFPEGTAGVDWSTSRLVAPWEQKYWHAEIRNGYISTYRMYNGWVPWYGRRPQWSWWSSAGLVGIFVVNAEYDMDLEGTVTTLILPSGSSSRIYPSTSYKWDLESATPVEFDEEGNPVKFTDLRTYIGGDVEVLQDWTQRTPIS